MICKKEPAMKPATRMGVGNTIEGFACTNGKPPCTPAQIETWLKRPAPMCCTVVNDIPIDTVMSNGQKCTNELLKKKCEGYTFEQIKDFVMAARGDGKTEKACCYLDI